MQNLTKERMQPPVSYSATDDFLQYTYFVLESSEDPSKVFSS